MESLGRLLESSRWNDPFPTERTRSDSDLFVADGHPYSVTTCSGFVIDGNCQVLSLYTVFYLVSNLAHHDVVGHER